LTDITTAQKRIESFLLLSGRSALAEGLEQAVVGGKELPLSRTPRRRHQRGNRGRRVSDTVAVALQSITEERQSGRYSGV
jgi:hypothetical protein